MKLNDIPLALAAISVACGLVWALGMLWERNLLQKGTEQVMSDIPGCDVYRVPDKELNHIAYVAVCDGSHKENQNAAHR